MTRRDLTDTDKRAWAAATRHVRPLSKQSGKVRSSNPVAPAREPMPFAARSASARELSPPQNRQNEKPVRRGKQAVSASFDLHGHTQDSAWRVLPHFLSREQARGSRCVIVITGKGKLGEGVLRRNFLHWLEMPEARNLVSGYAPAHARHGGNGAWYVFLRKR